MSSTLCAVLARGTDVANHDNVWPDLVFAKVTKNRQWHLALASLRTLAQGTLGYECMWARFIIRCFAV